MTNRIDRINEEIKRGIAAIIREVKDPRINGMISVVGVEATKDLKMAKVYVSVLGSDEQQKKTIDGLKSAEGFIRRELGDRVELHFTPELTFVLDHSIEQGARINELLNKVRPNDE